MLKSHPGSLYLLHDLSALIHWKRAIKNWEFCTSGILQIRDTKGLKRVNSEKDCIDILSAVLDWE